jgi:hypothetical protein
MRRAATLFSALLLGGCSSASTPNLEDSAPPVPPAIGNAQPLELTIEQRADVERGVQKRLKDPNSAIFGSMNARVSRNTSQSYIVCGWVNTGETGAYLGNEPFIAIYVPKMRVALLVGRGTDEPQTRAVRQRCIDEGVPLDV